jgi:hypothetical protein
MGGYYRSKHIQLLKIGMLVALLEDDIRILRKDHLEIGLALLDRIEVNMPKLSESSGRNDLAPIRNQILELVEKNGGEMQEKKLHSIMFREASPQEIVQLMQHLCGTEELIRTTRGIGGVQKVVFLRPWKVEELRKKGLIAQPVAVVPPSPVPAGPSTKDSSASAGQPLQPAKVFAGIALPPSVVGTVVLP